MTKSPKITFSVGYPTYSCDNQKHHITHDSSIPYEVGWWICRGETEGRTFIKSNYLKKGNSSIWKDDFLLAKDSSTFTAIALEIFEG